MSVHVRLRLGTEDYALPVEHVLEVFELGDLAAVPGAPPTALGVTNLRGNVLPVFDLAALFRIDAERARAQVVVAQDGSRRVGLAVDGVTGVGELSQPVEQTESEFLCGATLVDDGLVGIVDVRRLLDALEAGAAT